MMGKGRERKTNGRNHKSIPKHYQLSYDVNLWIEACARLFDCEHTSGLAACGFCFALCPEQRGDDDDGPGLRGLFRFSTTSFLDLVH